MAYDGKRIIPAGLMTISKNYDVTGDQNKVGSTFTISVNGYISAIKGSPNSDGEFYTGSFYEPDAREHPTFHEQLDEYEHFESIIRKQEALRTLFSEEGKEFYVQSFNGSAPLKCNPRNINISFDEGNHRWYHMCPYTLTMETDVLSVNGQLTGEDSFEQYISQADESWVVETIEDSDFTSQHTYSVTHAVSATGKRFYDETGALVKEAWEQAKDFVVTKLGYDSTEVNNSIISALSGMTEYNHVISETKDITSGSYTVQETWVLSQNPAVEVFEVSIERTEGHTTVAINGTVTGRESGSSKIQNATAYYDSIKGSLKNRAQEYSNLVLNNNPISETVAKDVVAGIITYSSEYDSVLNQYPDALFESIDISSNVSVDGKSDDIFGSHFVLGRHFGPVLQPLGATAERQISISINCTFPVTTFSISNPLLTEHSSITQDLVNNLIENYYIRFASNKSSSWNPKTGQASYNQTWVYEPEE